MNESYVDPTRKYPIDPMWEVTSKYYIDRMWEEYHKVKNDLAAVRIEASSAWQEYRKMKEELADTKSKLGQMDDYVNEVLKPQLADAKKLAQIEWELMIADGQRDHAKMRAEAAEAERDALLKVYEAAEDFIGAQGTAYENDQYLMLCGVLGAYNQQRGTHESQ